MHLGFLSDALSLWRCSGFWMVERGSDKKKNLAAGWTTLSSPNAKAASRISQVSPDLSGATRGRLIINQISVRKHAPGCFCGSSAPGTRRSASLTFNQSRSLITRWSLYLSICWVEATPSNHKGRGTCLDSYRASSIFCSFRPTFPFLLIL